MIDRATPDRSPCWGYGEPNWKARAAFALAVVGLLALGTAWAFRSGGGVATALDRQLDEAARSFVRDHARNHFDAAKRTLALSPIFKWFHEDFERAAGSVTAFVGRYADAATAAEIRSGVDGVEYLAYDWSLNGV